MHMKRSSLALVLPVLAAATPVHAAETTAPVSVTVTAKACEPNEITVPAGQVTFLITNKSSRLLEWEILKGVLVVDERENIAPGFKSKLTTKLEPGTYDITCGVIGNPKGKLIVTAVVGEAAKVTEADLIAPTADFRVASVGALGDLDTALKAFTAVATSGDAAARAKALDAVKRAWFELAVVNSALGDVAKPVAEDLAGLKPSETEPFAQGAIDKLNTDFETYRKAARALVPTAKAIVTGALGASERLQSLGRATKDNAGAVPEIEGLTGAIRMVAVRFAPIAAKTDAPLADDLKKAIETLKQATSGTDDQAIAAAAKDVNERMKRLSTALGY